MSDNRTLKRGRLTVELDRGQVFFDDPGRGTPAVVFCGNTCGTYWCVSDTGEFMDGPELTGAEKRWLASINDEVDEFLYGKDQTDA